MAISEKGLPYKCEVENLTMSSRCAYCGKPANTVDHVIPKCIYPKSVRMQGPQLITVPSCVECNSGFSDDEEHFRNIITLAGHNTETVNELYHSKVYRSFSESKSLRHLRQLSREMKEVDTATGKRHIIYPMKDEKFERIIRKIFLGLGYHHFGCCAPKENLSVDVVKYEIPEFIQQARWINVAPEVFQYLFGVYLTEEGFVSYWMIKFFESRFFMGTFEMLDEMQYDRKAVIDLREDLRSE